MAFSLKKKQKTSWLNISLSIQYYRAETRSGSHGLPYQVTILIEAIPTHWLPVTPDVIGIISAESGNAINRFWFGSSTVATSSHSFSLYYNTPTWRYTYTLLRTVIPIVMGVGIYLKKWPQPRHEHDMQPTSTSNSNPLRMRMEIHAVTTGWTTVMLTFSCSQSECTKSTLSGWFCLDAGPNLHTQWPSQRIFCFTRAFFLLGASNHYVAARRVKSTRGTLELQIVAYC